MLAFFNPIKRYLPCQLIKLIMLPYSPPKNGKFLLTVAFQVQKTLFLAIFAIFGRLWMVVYTAKIKILKIV